MITLPEARELREQLSPAFAGYVTDGNISDRDVLATLMDLVARGYIGLDADTQKKTVKVRKIYFVKSSKRLLAFEKKFMEVLFKEKKELNVKEVKGIIDSKGLHNAINENTESLTKSKIVKSLVLLMDKNEEIKNISYYKEEINAERGQSRFGTKKKLKTIDDLREYMVTTSTYVKVSLVMLVLFLILFCVIYLFIYLPSQRYHSPNDIYNMLEFMIFLVLYLCTITLAIIKYLEIRRLKKLLAFQFENNIIPFTKKKYEELFEFIQKYPLRQQRLYNEFMPHAVAFGLDTSWNKSFGVPTEVVVKSRAKQDLPDKVKSRVSDSDFVEHK